MKTIFLSAKSYQDQSKNYGDCIIIDTGIELVIYDCGSEEHAIRVEQYMQDHDYEKVKVVLSHNDSDHFEGITYLADRSLVSEIYTQLLFKYDKEILNLIDDASRTEPGIIQRIKEICDNINSLSGQNLKDAFIDTVVADGVCIVGPGKEYTLSAIAKAIDSREGDTIDNETILNAISLQVSVEYGSNKNLLLTGDASFAALENQLQNHQAIQLPHHGKLAQAEDIFDRKSNDAIYFVSDNTGDSNGGSDELRKKHPAGHVIYYSTDGDQICTLGEFGSTSYRTSYYRGVE